MQALWESILSHPFDSLTYGILLRFLVIYLPMQKLIDADDFEKDHQRLEVWATPDMVKEVVSLMNQAPGLIFLSPEQ